MERERASIDILLNVKPKAFIIAKVEITEAGMANALIKVVLMLRRNMRTASMAKIPPYIR